MHLSALKNLANTIALASDPPLPIVVILFSLFIPWKPVTIGIPPDFKYFINYFLFTWSIFEYLCLSSVIIGLCRPIHYLELKPLWINLPAIKAQDTCSTDETSTSYSAFEKLLLIFFDLFTKSLVTPLIADATTITLYYFFV